ncbi:ATP-binding cassette domain-containing protein [Sporolactobacillus terrae]|nr:AAA family ATPase [Sporolactobacillus terrae]
MMKIRHLTYNYPKNHKLIFDNLSLSIVPGKVNVLIGMNGEGKTTLFDIVSDLVKTDAEMNDRVPIKDILYQIQGVPILSTINGKSLAELILCSSGQYHLKDITPKLFEPLLGNDPDSVRKIAYLWRMQYGKMSPGERRWITILLYCLINKSLYLFDEPTAGVDRYSANQILRQIQMLNKRKKKTIFIATHQIEDVAYFSHFQIHVLAHGQIVLCEDQDNWIKEAKKSKLPFLKACINDLIRCRTE